MSNTAPRLFHVLFRIALHGSLVIALASCGDNSGSSNSSGGGDSAGDTTLFEDIFTASSLSKWTISGSGTASHDATVGYPALGSMKMTGNSNARAFASSFSVADGAQFHIRVKIPESTVAETNIRTGVMIEIESAELGTGRALVGIWRSPCSLIAAPATRFEYTIHAPSGGGNTFFWEDFNCDSAPDDRFVEFVFVVNPDGSTQWRRDGVTVLSFAPSFGTGGVRLTLHGGGTDAGSIPGFFLWYDDVTVTNP